MVSKTDDSTKSGMTAGEAEGGIWRSKMTKKIRSVCGLRG
jgi:hypothetical protein